MYVLAQDSTVTVPLTYELFQITGVSNETNAEITYSINTAIGSPPQTADTFTAAETITISDSPIGGSIYNREYTITSASLAGNVMTIVTSTDTSAAGNALTFLNGALAARADYTDTNATEDSEFLLPADRCTWHVQPDTSAKGGYKVVNVKFYDGNSSSPADQTGNWRVGYVGKTGRFTPITNVTDV